MRTGITRLIAAALLAASPAFAASPFILDETALPGGNRYERCLSLVKKNARDAVAVAEAWHDSAGGGAAALHCAALALVSLRRYAEAGVKLDQAALAEQSVNRDASVDLYDQAGNAWLLAGQPQKGEASLTAALALAPKDEELLFDRARARAAHKDWPGADSDLSAVLAEDADRVDALVLRASARHAEGRKAEASADIARALDLYPNYPEALVERGTMKYEAGDVIGARADWQAVVDDEPHGDAATAARQRLAETAAPSAKPQSK